MDVGQLGVAVRSGNRAGELAAGEDLAKQGIELVARPAAPKEGAAV